MRKLVNRFKEVPGFNFEFENYAAKIPHATQSFGLHFFFAKVNVFRKITSAHKYILETEKGNPKREKTYRGFSHATYSA